MNSINNEKGIISLVVIMTIGLFALATVSVSLVAALNEFAKERDITQSNNTLYASEAAAREGIYQYRESFLDDGDVLALANINDMQNESVEINDLAWPYTEVIARVNNDPGYNRTILYVMNNFPEGEAFNHAVYSENAVTLGGNASVTGSVLANNDIELSGNAEINGDAYSLNPIEDTSNITGEAFVTDDFMPVPLIDLSKYSDEAALAGTFFDNEDDANDYIDDNIKNKTISTNMYVKNVAEVEITGNDTALTGSIATEGDLKITGGTFTASPNHIALIVMGDLRITGSPVINGIVYVAGTTTFSGGTPVINGSLISSSNITTDITGNVEIIYDSDYIGELEDILGLVTTSTAKPIISSWKEE